MKASTIIGIVLVVLGIAVFVFPRLTWTEEETVIDAGPLQVETEEQRQIPLPPILGGLSLLGGVALIIAGSRR